MVLLLAEAQPRQRTHATQHVSPIMLPSSKTIVSTLILIGCWNLGNPVHWGCVLLVVDAVPHGFLVRWGGQPVPLNTPFCVATMLRSQKAFKRLAACSDLGEIDLSDTERGVAERPAGTMVNHSTVHAKRSRTGHIETALPDNLNTWDSKDDLGHKGDNNIDPLGVSLPSRPCPPCPPTASGGSPPSRPCPPCPPAAVGGSPPSRPCPPCPPTGQSADQLTAAPVELPAQAPDMAPRPQLDMGCLPPPQLDNGSKYCVGNGSLKQIATQPHTNSLPLPVWDPYLDALTGEESCQYWRGRCTCGSHEDTQPYSL